MLRPLNPYIVHYFCGQIGALKLVQLVLLKKRPTAGTE